MAKLQITGADGAEFEHELTAEVTLGRDASADLTVQDAKVSRKHCRFFEVLGGWNVEDLGSSNGIRVNGKPAKKHQLRHGDHVAAGHSKVVYVVEQKRMAAPLRKSSARDRLGHTRKA